MEEVALVEKVAKVIGISDLANSLLVLVLSVVILLCLWRLGWLRRR